MQAFAELAPFTVHSLGESPFPGFWSFNPSVVRTPDGKWLCSVRCANYHLPGSTIQPARKAGPVRNRNVMLEIDRDGWRVTRSVEITDRSSQRHPPIWNAALGFEDLRLVYTAEDGLCATASAMRADDGTLEIVLLKLDEDYQIKATTPLRGGWSGSHQKNWSPFAGADSFFALYSVLGGGVHDRDGRITPLHDALALPAVSHKGPHATQINNGSMEIRISHGRTIRPNEPPVEPRLALRGGTQLVYVDDGRWLGLAHGCLVGVGKYYWHRAYEVDCDGVLLSLSEPFKLAPNKGIEFAAGLALEPVTNRLVISFGLEDDSAWLGVTGLDEVLATLHEVAA